MLRFCIQPLSLDFESKETLGLDCFSIPTPIPLGVPLLFKDSSSPKGNQKLFFSFPPISADMSERLSFSSVKWTCYSLMAWQRALRSWQQCWRHSAAQTQVVAAAGITGVTALLMSPAVLPKKSLLTESPEGNFTGFEQHMHSVNICWQNKSIYLRASGWCWRLFSLQLTGLLIVRWSFWSVSSSEGSIFILIEEQL